MNGIDVTEIRNKYPVGTRICLDRMNDIQAPPAGTCGTVRLVDDIGNINMSWDNGCGLSLIPNEDQFHVI